MFGIGAGEFVLILIAGLILFGPSKLPELARSLGKALREFRKAQAAFSKTLEESAEDSPKKSSPQKISEEKNLSSEKISEEKNLSSEKISEEKKSATTVDDVINLAKKNPFVEENMHEKIFNGGADNFAVADGGARDESARGNSNGVGKKSEPAKN